eukprot:2784613-Alexandrium_andersonii.AAC.1
MQALATTHRHKHAQTQASERATTHRHKRSQKHAAVCIAAPAVDRFLPCAPTVTQVTARAHECTHALPTLDTLVREGLSLLSSECPEPVSYTHLRAHETSAHL